MTERDTTRILRGSNSGEVGDHMSPKCEFDDGRPHDADAEFTVSRRDEYGHFRREMHFCLYHFVVYAQVIAEEREIPA